MASLPLLNNNLIATGIKPVEVPDPITLAEQSSRATILRQQAAQGPLKAQELANTVQAGQTQNQEQQLALQKQQKDRQDQDTLHTEMTDPGNLKPDGTPDWDKVIAKIAPKVQPSSVQAWQNLALTRQNEIDKQTLNQKNLNALKYQAIGNANSSLLELPLEQRAGAYPQIRQQLIDQKFIDANDPTYPETPGDLSDPTLKAHLAGVGLLNAWTKESLEKSQAARQAEMAKRVGEQYQTAARQDKINQAVAAHLGVTNQEQHSEWLENLGPDIKPMFQNFTNFDPSTPQGQATATKIQEMALSPNQRATQADRKQRADAMTQRANQTPGALAVLASDPTQTSEVRQSAANALQLQQKTKAAGASANQQMIQSRDDEREAKLQKELQGQEAQLWQLKAQYKNRIQKASADGQSTIKDPKSGRDMPIEDATTLMNGVDQRAQILNNQQDEILKRHQWGKYTPALSSAPAASANPAGPQAPPSAATKTFPRSRLAAFATANKVSPQQAEASLKSKGYAITEDTQPQPAPTANQ